MLRTRLTTFAVLTVAIAFSGVALFPDQAVAHPPPPTKRSNHVPNVGILADGEQPLGDMWTFNCPAGGSVVASVDTKDDTDLGTATLDPTLELLDGNGVEIADVDDENVPIRSPDKVKGLVPGVSAPSLPALPPTP